ncbi:AraC family transcriptional regulator [Chitinophaga pendula]|uniref:helix-turn-helix domain-containing protein n=1 Tax=Chitinophaga TaxID=79328 RepID=UPI000BB07D89|nr:MULTISPECIES: AraC family transcriptional regulator [Chitinophaga]ASZ13491.1 hypothetical protein CK934_22300 [Chitinophaga sp. MD30]UCJ08879.1 AraC family transcriptional regulator [Chitinophaga pendula]
MYFTCLPDHTEPGFNESQHFSKFKKHNIIFNAESSESFCDDHVGCLSIKTILNGEECYGIDGRQLMVRPGLFLVLNNDQRYSCRISSKEKVRSLSIFFRTEFAASVLFDISHTEDSLLEYPFPESKALPEFFQTLQYITPDMGFQLSALLRLLETKGYHKTMTDECLVFLLRNLIELHRSDKKRVSNIMAIKATTRQEIYRRLCIAKDVLHSSCQEDLDLNKVSAEACMSVPQLVRQFKSAFQTTPHQYLTRIRLEQAAGLLQRSNEPVHDIAWKCGFESASAFSRIFKAAYGIQPTSFRKGHKN